MIYLTSDQHYGHKNIIEYCNRPFSSIEEMDITLIKNHNEVVKNNDIVIHCGDFTLNKAQYAEKIIKQLNGSHIFVTGSHDKWMDNVEHVIDGKPISLPGYVFERKFDNRYLVACHYAMRVWPRSHYGSIQVYGHSHGNLKPFENQLDVGVDSWNFYPISLNKVLENINVNKVAKNGLEIKGN